MHQRGQRAQAVARNLIDNINVTRQCQRNKRVDRWVFSKSPRNAKVVIPGNCQLVTGPYRSFASLPCVSKPITLRIGKTSYVKGSY